MSNVYYDIPTPSANLFSNDHRDIYFCKKLLSMTITPQTLKTAQEMYRYIKLNLTDYSIYLLGVDPSAILTVMLVSRSEAFSRGSPEHFE